MIGRIIALFHAVWKHLYCDGDRMMNSKAAPITILVLLLAFFLVACTPGSAPDPDSLTTGSKSGTQQATADQTTSPPGDNSSLLVIKDFLTPEEINAILGIKPKGYRDYNMYQDNAWAYFDFDEDTILSLISVGTDILELISIEKK